MTQRDPVTIARGIVAAPRKLSTVASSDMLAICQALVESEDRPQISNELARAIAALLRLHDAMEGRPLPGIDGLIHRDGGLAEARAFEAALKTFKTTFEEEFPDV